MAIIWNRVTWYSKLLAFVAFIGVFVLGLYLGAMYNEATHYSISDIPPSILLASPASLYRGSAVVATTLATSSLRLFSWIYPKISKPASASTTKPTPVVTPTPIVTPTPVSNSSETHITAYLTAYTYWDNTPPGSSQISNPIIHSLAGGTGTYSDPITVAVGHSIMGGQDTLDYPAGTKFYVPNLHKYFIVEDTCGDGSTPQNGPCHTGYQGHPWLDLWIDGATGTRSTADTCANEVTDLHLIIEDPASNYAVTSGSVYNNGCAQQYGDTVVVSS